MNGAARSNIVPSGVQGACPNGWHVPSDNEWIFLLGSVDDSPGGKMKEAGTTHWISPDTGATNTSGFSGLPGGFRYDFGTECSVIGRYAWFCLTTEYNASEARTWAMHWLNGGVGGIAVNLRASGI